MTKKMEEKNQKNIKTNAKQMRICLNNLSTDRWTNKDKSYVGIFLETNYRNYP